MKKGKITKIFNLPSDILISILSWLFPRDYWFGAALVNWEWRNAFIFHATNEIELIDEFLFSDGVFEWRTNTWNELDLLILFKKENFNYDKITNGNRLCFYSHAYLVELSIWSINPSILKRYGTSENILFAIQDFIADPDPNYDCIYMTHKVTDRFIDSVIGVKNHFFKQLWSAQSNPDANSVLTIIMEKLLCLKPTISNFINLLLYDPLQKKCKEKLKQLQEVRKTFLLN